MSSQTIEFFRSLFDSRLATLEHLLKSAQAHLGDSDALLQQRIAPDMFPLGTQIVFTCNQPRNFALWCEGKPADNLDPEVASMGVAYEYLSATRQLLAGITAADHQLAEVTRINLGQGLYLELSGSAYVNDFLIPNLYFHLVTAYDILRMAGVPIGKRDYMLHLVPFLKHEPYEDRK
ncbi:DUF1993 domain-containing protein [Alkalinema sp. FACHB-956]|uniref:DUF1993 domain-containing protein n=1 Tax=Alkalinema sp. FACHB-956 TaxID=2692768 RepID=UPI001688CCA9|nr:DUF1993 domain-containing protein [Alkalinema sp. FACHB-956]MBD2326057.1 DUF1993 domain-containing protein [Alkalinema sp. FACHB-956]